MHYALERIRMLFRRRRSARVLNVPYSRGRDFRVPRSITLNGKAFPLELPEQQGTRVAFANIFLDDCYGLERYFSAMPIRSVLDIGANVGLFSLAARLRYPEAVIHAYEPDRELAQYLDAQARVGRFEVTYAAVGEEDGSARLIRSSDSVLNQALSDAAGDIPQIAFATALRRIGEAVDLVKMDCEGAEWDILRDGPAWRRVRALAMEYHLIAGRTHEMACQVVDALGFTILERARSIGCGIILAVRN